MKEDFEAVKAQIRIEEVATYLMGQPIKAMYRFPEEKTASVRIYPESQSFYDFGRATGGDAVKLWSHIKQCDNWTAARQICSVFGLSWQFSDEDRESINGRIEAQKRADEAFRMDEERKKKRWSIEVGKIKKQIEIYDNLLDSPHVPPLSEPWVWCKNLKQVAEHKLDCLCEVEGR